MNIFDRLEKQGFMMMDMFNSFKELMDSAREEYRPGATEESEEEAFDSSPRPPGFDNEKYDLEDGEENAFMAAHAMEDSYNCEEEMYADFSEEMIDGTSPVNSGQEAFPGRKAFALRDIDAEDPAFWRGKEIGIPINLAIRVTPDQGLQLPIAGRGPTYRGF